jgi:hypothetical protein
VNDVETLIARLGGTVVVDYSPDTQLLGALVVARRNLDVDWPIDFRHTQRVDLLVLHEPGNTSILKGAVKAGLRDTPQRTLYFSINKLGSEGDEDAVAVEDFIAAVDPRMTLLVGKKTVALWRDDVVLKFFSGEWAIWRGRWAVSPVPSQDASRGGRDVERGLKRLVNGLEDNGEDHDGMLHQLTIACAGCQGTAYAWDEDAVGWCRAHAKKGLNGRRLQDAKFKAARQKEQNLRLQKGMFE